MKEYCMYVVVDIETGYVLANGEKYKDFSGMTVNGYFRERFFFWRKIRQYYKLKTICDRTCVVVYFAGGKDKNSVMSVIYYDGMKLSLRGSKYCPGRYIGNNVLRIVGLPECANE